MKTFAYKHPGSTCYLLLMILMWTGPMLSPAQVRPSDKLFGQLSNQKGITSMSFSKNFIDMIDMDLSDEEADPLNVTGPLQEIKMTICSKEEAPGWAEKIMTYMKSRPFNEIKEKDSEDSCQLFVHKKRRKIKACHVLFNGDQSLVMLSFFGDFKIEDIKGLTQKAREMK